jgi:hypothetical protein
MQFGDIRGTLQTIIDLLRRVDRNTHCTSCGGDAAITSAGTGSSIPAGFKSIAIIKTSSNADTVTITLSDATTYVLTELGEVFADAASSGGVLPAYTIAGPGTWKWHGIK